MTKHRWFDVQALESELVRALEWLDSSVLSPQYWFANALYEALVGRPLRGESSQVVKGHDHVPVATWAGEGGRVIPKGTIWSGGTVGQPWLACSLSAVSTWTRADNTLATSRPGHMFEVPVSKGLQSSGAPPGSPPYLQALVYLRYTSAFAPTLDARLVNLTHGGASAVSAISTGDTSVEGWFVIDQVPCFSGWNDLNLELRSDLGSPPTSFTVSVQHLLLMERPSTAKVASVGTTTLA